MEKKKSGGCYCGPPIEEEQKENKQENEINKIDNNNNNNNKEEQDTTRSEKRRKCCDMCQCNNNKKKKRKNKNNEIDSTSGSDDESEYSNSSEEEDENEDKMKRKKSNKKKSDEDNEDNNISGSKRRSQLNNNINNINNNNNNNNNNGFYKNESDDEIYEFEEKNYENDDQRIGKNRIPLRPDRTRDGSPDSSYSSSTTTNKDFNHGQQKIQCCDKCSKDNRPNGRACLCQVPSTHRRGVLGESGCITCGCVGCHPTDLLETKSSSSFIITNNNNNSNNSNKNNSNSDVGSNKSSNGNNGNSVDELKNGCCRPCMKAFSENDKACLCQVPSSVRLGVLPEGGCRICKCKGCHPEEFTKKRFDNRVGNGKRILPYQQQSSQQYHPIDSRNPYDDYYGRYPPIPHHFYPPPPPPQYRGHHHHHHPPPPPPPPHHHAYPPYSGYPDIHHPPPPLWDGYDSRDPRGVLSGYGPDKKSSYRDGMVGGFERDRSKERMIDNRSDYSDRDYSRGRDRDFDDRDLSRESTRSRDRSRERDRTRSRDRSRERYANDNYNNSSNNNINNNGSNNINKYKENYYGGSSYSEDDFGKSQTTKDYDLYEKENQYEKKKESDWYSPNYTFSNNNKRI
ncbi:hypothetical protein ACTFIZ_009590 [Dictyostelium cf. discoideum]